MSKSRLEFERVFSSPDISPYDQITWETRTARITNAKGEVIFEQENVDVPSDWSQTATNIVANKYLHGKLGTPQREPGVRSMVSRVVDTIVESGISQGYFDQEQGSIFGAELAAIILQQQASFNSPVWFNVGCQKMSPDSKAKNWHWDNVKKDVVFGQVGYHRPQCSACFILGIEDSMESIMEVARTEAMLFKYGSGSGVNMSPLRSSSENLSAGGISSGPLSFMKGLDSFAGAIKSGGATRRAACIRILNADHPDIEEFIDCKSKEEAKAHTLIREGYDGSTPDSEAYASISFQNANHSVRVTDEFMFCLDQLNDNVTWPLKSVVGGQVVREVKARHLGFKIAKAAWTCGDPGIQYDTTINKWHTCPNSGRINSTNPCSEFMYLDDTACNLASINLLKFMEFHHSEGTRKQVFALQKFSHTVRILITAMDILVDLSGYPTEKIARNSHDYRPLGLGYANLGALLMASGLPYDSDKSRALAAVITSIMCGEAYLQSAKIAVAMPPLEPATDLVNQYNLENGWPNETGACPGFYLNKEPFVGVINLHSNNTWSIPPITGLINDLREYASQIWGSAETLGRRAGYRNAQTTLLAPTGTIGFMMDAQTTGIEPELALVKHKKLVGGGQLKMVNDLVPQALRSLGYYDERIQSIVDFISEQGTIEGAPSIKDEHLPVFDCSFKPQKGTRSIHYMGHVKMVAAVQPFLSGGVSKTSNVPADATVEDIENLYIEAWKLGLKSITVYRDGSKGAQPLVTSGGTSKDTPQEVLTRLDTIDLLASPPKAVRHRLPDERNSITHKYSIAGHEGYLIIGLYPNGEPGEIFVKASKEGSTISGLMDSVAIAISLGLQHGVPLKTFVDKFSHIRFEPAGFTPNPDIRLAKSPIDYIARFLETRFIKGQQQKLFGISGETPIEEIEINPDAPPCGTCGAIMVRNGSCYKCQVCGSTSGCS